MIDADTRRLRKVVQRTVDCLRYVEDPTKRAAARSDFTLAFDPPTVLALLGEIDRLARRVEAAERLGEMAKMLGLGLMLRTQLDAFDASREREDG